MTRDDQVGETCLESVDLGAEVDDLVGQRGIGEIRPVAVIHQD